MSLPLPASDLVLEVVTLRYKTVEQVLPLIQPVVPAPGTVSGLSGKLVVRTTPANLAEVKRVLAALDRPPRRLLITVLQDADRSVSSGSVQSPPSRAAAAGAPGSRRHPSGFGDPGATRVYSTQSASNDRHAQQVQVIEGHEASIDVGYSVPVTVRRAVPGAVGGRMYEQWVDVVEYRDILSGFLVRPRLAGNVVTLEVSPRHDTPGPYGRGSTNVQRIGTTVSGQLGEWIELGAVVTGDAFESGTATYRTGAASADNRRILIRAEALD
ncbi:MAG: hypothetical protein EHM59_06270 [Betaproteobacteria bacterium]|nr:MAG: hypothetical protein EHM59_06270 [Betaproteobacteria bacterium]